MSSILIISEQGKVEIVISILLGCSLMLLTFLNLLISNYAKILSNFIQNRTHFYERAILV